MIQCPTVGCGWEPATDRHIKEVHTACSCGWAGTKFGMHVAQRARRAAEGYRDEGEGVHERIDMRYDGERWVRVSTPG